MSHQKRGMILKFILGRNQQAFNGSISQVVPLRQALCGNGHQNNQDVYTPADSVVLQAIQSGLSKILTT